MKSLDKNLRLHGQRIYLRPLTRKDATREYAGWLNDRGTTRYMESGRKKETVRSLAKYIERFRIRDDTLFLAIVLKEGDRHIGNVKLEPINWTHRHAVLGIMIGDPAARGKGMGVEAIRILLRHAFGRLKLHRVALGVTGDNLPGIRCYEKVGFKVEGRFRETVLRGCRYVDSLWMAILADEFYRQYGH